VRGKQRGRGRGRRNQRLHLFGQR